MFGIIATALVLWEKIGKEELPEFAMEWIRVSIRYPGASAQDVELFVTKPIEEKLKGLSGIKEVASTSSYNNASFNITFAPNTINLSEKIQEVKEAIESAHLPREVDDPIYRQFRSAEKAFIDIGLYLKETEILDIKDRQKLQSYALALKNRLLSLPEISGVEEKGYLRPELQIKVSPKNLERHEISMHQVRNQIIEKHIRRPVGNLLDEEESDISVASELVDIESLQNTIISSSFQGKSVLLKNIAIVEHGFEKTNTILKVQGNEGIIIEALKSQNTDILSAQKAVIKFIENFQKTHASSNLGIIVMDDESYDVRNRIGLIGTNGAIGFLLIFIILFLFLDFKSGFWIGMGIPFSLAFTLIAAMVMGYTINNMTLAAIIVVLGIVVDDAIIVAENIVRRSEKQDSLDFTDDVTNATNRVVKPVIASILTTCVAFIPLYFFTGRFGLMVKFIPAIIFLMLFSSLLESFLILPSHMAHPLPWEGAFKNHNAFKIFASIRTQLTHSLERFYEAFVARFLRYKYFILIAFTLLLFGGGKLFVDHMKYVMFPAEEANDFRVKVVAEKGTNRIAMAKKIRPIEDIFINNPNVTSVQSSIGQSRRGGQVNENEASIAVEIVPLSERQFTLNQLFEIWQKEFKNHPDFLEIKLQRQRFGSDSGSPIAIEIQENNDQIRNTVIQRLVEELKNIPQLRDIEIERPVTKPEYSLQIKRTEASRLSIKYDDIASVLRSYVEGDILYTFNSSEEEIDVRFTSEASQKSSIDDILNLTVANQHNYLVPIKNLVTVQRGPKPANIRRTNYKRTTAIFADLIPNAETTPLEIAEYIENTIIPTVVDGFPSTAIIFRGEVEDSRESLSDFTVAIGLVVLLIYVILVFLFDSIVIPFLIALIIPFGVVGTTLAFWGHGLTQYGFFAVVGTLGMIGVVINDSIVLIDKMLLDLKDQYLDTPELIKKVAYISSTRLRAVILTTVTTVAGVLPTAYGFGGYDSMLAEMMLALAWGLMFGTIITLILVPCVFLIYMQCINLRRKVTKS